MEHIVDVATVRDCKALRAEVRVAILVYIGFRYNAPTRFRYIHIYIHRI